MSDESKPFFESLWWNVGLSMLSVFGIAKYTMAVWTAGSFNPGGLNLLIWLVLGFHFFRATLIALRERRTKGGNRA